jgi:hypothetical protein
MLLELESGEVTLRAIVHLTERRAAGPEAAAAAAGVPSPAMVDKEQAAISQNECCSRQMQASPPTATRRC